MNQLYLVRHAKSSWSDPALDDFRRPLNQRGEKNAIEMGRRLGSMAVCPDLIATSPAKRARKTAAALASGCGCKKTVIRYFDDLYLGTRAFHLELIGRLAADVAVLFVVGHNPTITDLAEYLTGMNLGNVPTCGVIGLEYAADIPFAEQSTSGKLLFYDFPNRWRLEEQTGE